MKFSDQRQGNDENKTAFYSFAIFGYGFLLIIALIAVFNIINSMNTSVSARMNQYGMMRSVGMSIKQLQHMVMAEAGTYSVCGCLAGCILGLPLHKFLYAKAITSHWGIAWQIPVSTLAIIVIIVFIAAVISVIGPVKKISKIDIVNVINAQ
jgi:putative ABC transport system permease protein